MHPSDDMERNSMDLNSTEASIFFDCQNKVSFVASFFSQENKKVELDHRSQAGLALVLLEVLEVLYALEDGKYCDPQTAEAVSEERTQRLAKRRTRTNKLKPRGCNNGQKSEK